MTSSSPSTRGARKRSAWPFYLVVGLILAALPVSYFLLLESSPPPPPPPPAPALAVQAPDVPRVPEMHLTEVTGQVEIRRGEGAWAPAERGALLRQADSVRTLSGAQAVLAGGENYHVKMESDTEVSVEELTESISRVLLGNGMATATVNGASRHVFEVRAAGSDAKARTAAGSFTVSNNGSGTVAVASREGEVELESREKAVIVRAGQQSIVRPGKAPTAPTPVPSSLLLKVRWPTTREVNTRKIVLAGEVEPGSMVWIADKPVRVDARGRFSTPVTLREGKNLLDVRARSVSGESHDLQEVKLDTRVDFELGSPDWGKRDKKQ